jgi:hypothetical protein
VDSTLLWYGPFRPLRSCHQSKTNPPPPPNNKHTITGWYNYLRTLSGFEQAKEKCYVGRQTSSQPTRLPNTCNAQRLHTIPLPLNFTFTVAVIPAPRREKGRKYEPTTVTVSEYGSRCSLRKPTYALHSLQFMRFQVIKALFMSIVMMVEAVNTSETSVNF